MENNFCLWWSCPSIEIHTNAKTNDIGVFIIVIEKICPILVAILACYSFHYIIRLFVLLFFHENDNNIILYIIYNTVSKISWPMVLILRHFVVKWGPSIIKKWSHINTNWNCVLKWNMMFCHFHLTDQYGLWCFHVEPFLCEIFYKFYRSLVEGK